MSVDASPGVGTSAPVTDGMPDVSPQSGVDTDASEATAPRLARWGHADQVLVNVFVVLIVLTQRVGIPMMGTSISVALPLGYLLIAVLAVRGALGISRIRAELLVIGVTATLVATTIVGLRGGNVSIPSLLLLLSIYLPWMLRARGSADGRRIVTSAGRTFIRLMMVVATVGVLQLVAQFAGVWRFEDYLQDWLGADYIVPHYNFSNEVAWEAGIFKATAFVLLEPSFLSQLCALAIIIGFMLRIRAWQILVLAAGMGASVSGTGIILLAAGLVFLVLRAARLLRPGYVVAAAVAVALVLASPVASIFAERSGEVTQADSSGHARFVEPYAQVYEAMGDRPVLYLHGAGPGTSEELLQTYSIGYSDIVLYSVVPKLAYEYGIVAGGLFAVLLLVSILRGAPWRVVPGSIFVMIFFLSGALLQPQTAFLAWVFTTLGSREDSAAV
jgi:hypothetical protein